MPERVWEPFLTERDRAHLALRPARRRGFGQRPALLLIDLYRGVYGDRPLPLLDAVEEWPSSCGLEAWDALPRVQRLLDAARASRIPVIFTTGIDENAAYGWGTGSPPTEPAALERWHRRYDIIDEVAPRPGELIIRKASPSCFWGTPLPGYLTALGVDTIITVGESTSGCVRAAVVDGCTYRYRMIVVEEGVFDRHQATHALNLFDMHQKYADVLPLAEVLEHLHGGVE